MRARAIGRRASIGRKAPRTDQGSVVPRSVRVWLFSVKNSQGFLGAFERRSPLGRQILSRPIHVKSQKRQGRPKRARFAAAAVLRRPFQGTRDRIRIVSSKYALRKVDCVAPLGDRRGPVAPCSSGCSARGLSLLAHKHLRLYFLDSKRLAFDSQMPGCRSLRQDTQERKCVRTLGQCLCPTWRYGDVDLETARVATPRPFAGAPTGRFHLAA